MDNRPLIALLGESLLMDGVAVSLEDREVLEVMRLDASIPDIGGCLRFLAPDVVVFELDIPQYSSIVSLLRQQPGIRLLGLEPDSNRVVVLNSRHHSARTMGDLYHVVQTTAGDQAGSLKGGGPAR